VLAVSLYAGGAAAMSNEYSSDIIGEVVLASSLHADTLSDLARAYDQGYQEMRLANPSIDPWLPGDDTEIVVPSLYVLPDAPREGIVVNVPEMRLYHFPRKRKGKAQPRVESYPVSIGRQQWTTPHGVTKIVAKAKDPAWYPPESIREEHAAQGDPLPKVVPAGPDNPLGSFAIRLGIPGYLIHGTNRPYGIGMRVTHGCIRMYPKDIEAVFSSTRVGTKVRIVNQPYKVGIAYGQVYLEVHPYLPEDTDIFEDQYSRVVKLVVDKTAGQDVKLNWNRLREVIIRKDGIPTVIGTVATPVEGPAKQSAGNRDAKLIGLN
jgi:L,D-transpeptidase ErfK/SrfK